MSATESGPDYIIEALWPLCAPIDEPQIMAGNARVGDIESVMRSLKALKQRKPITCRTDTKEVTAGNHTLQAARRLGWTEIAVVWIDDDDATAKAWALADNRTSDLGSYDEEALAGLIADVLEGDADLLEATSFNMEDLDAMIASTAAPSEIPEEPAAEAPEAAPEARENPLEGLKRQEPQKITLSLFDRFLAPPFSVLNAREKWWQDRKNTWIGLGLEGELGRDDKPRTWFMATPQHHHHPDRPFVEAGAAERKAKEAEEAPDPDSPEAAADDLLYGVGSTSIFDPVLCEIMYRWFTPPKGVVLDPFAGGSVRGIVASKLGRGYVGYDVRANQIEANERQGEALLTDGIGIVPDVPEDNMPTTTQVDHFSGEDLWFKREDLYAFAGVRGAKVRTCVHFILEAQEKGVGVVTAGSRLSPQVNFVAQIARRLKVKCRVHVPSGPLTPELLAARGAGAEIVQHDYGYNSVIIARAREDAAERGWVEIPYGMESQEAVEYTRPQVVNIPEGVERIVNACGSGMTLAGILWGLKDSGRSIPVTAVCVGHVPEERLDKWAPPDWRDMVEIIDDPSDYHAPAPVCEVTSAWGESILLDSFYEAKCIPHLRKGDCLWVSAIRPSAVPTSTPTPIWIAEDAARIDTVWPESVGQVDAIVTCPPYGDLEVYSDDPRDISTMDYPEFLAAFSDIMHKSVARLKENRFALVVVGDFRGPDGNYRGFPVDTVRIMQDAGMHLYNEAILVTHAGSLPLRAGRQFDASRKLGKTHQSVLVFVKGDAKKATIDCGPVVAVDVNEVAE